MNVNEYDVTTKKRRRHSSPPVIAAVDPASSSHSGRRAASLLRKREVISAAATIASLLYAYGSAAGTLHAILPRLRQSEDSNLYFGKSKTGLGTEAGLHSVSSAYQTRVWPRVVCANSGWPRGRSCGSHLRRMPQKEERRKGNMATTKDVSRDYRRHRKEDLDSGNCVPMHEWQRLSFPTCNAVHENDIAALGTRDRVVGLIGAGFYRFTWLGRNSDFPHEDEEEFVLKTQRFDRRFHEHNNDGSRREAIISERLTSSRHIIDIYGFCGNSGLFEFGYGGVLQDAIREERTKHTQSPVSSSDRLKIAVALSQAVADLHSIDRGDRASVAHSDLKVDQFIKVGANFKLTDFNMAQFIRRDKASNSTCPFKANHGSKIQAPEEFERTGLSEKVDVYRLGNILYSLLTGLEVFHDKSKNEARRLVIAGERPKVPSYLERGFDREDIAIANAMKMCFVHDPIERFSAREVSEFLTRELSRTVRHTRESKQR